MKVHVTVVWEMGINAAVKHFDFVFMAEIILL
jgi:hypothetical protein